MKLRKLHIEDCKMFKDVDISFLDDNDEALPIIVLAGVNGSGKTTLLEHILTIQKGMTFKDNDGNIISDLFEKCQDTTVTDINGKPIMRGKPLRSANEYNDYIVNIPVSMDKIDNIKETIRKKYIDRAFEIDKPSEALKELQIYIKEVFEGLELSFNLASIDYNKKEVLFQDNSGNTFDIDKLSTGEKTLLSKVLYLYFQRYKDKVILIDEPELSLHPSWQNKVLKIYENFAKQNNCQIIIATHSPHIVGSAKPEYLRLLKKENGKIVVIDNIDKSYGLEFDQVLTDIMGVENLRTPDVAKDIKRLWKLLEDENYESEEYKNLYLKLEKDLGDLDKDMVLSRLEIAKIKSRNAES